MKREDRRFPAVFFREKPGPKLGWRIIDIEPSVFFCYLFLPFFRTGVLFNLVFRFWSERMSRNTWKTLSSQFIYRLAKLSGPRVFRNWRGQCYFDSVNFPFLSLSRAPHSINHLGPRARVSIFALPISHFFTAIWPQIHISDNWTHFPLIRIGLDRGESKGPISTDFQIFISCSALFHIGALFRFLLNNGFLSSLMKDESSALSTLMTWTTREQKAPDLSTDPRSIGMIPSEWKMLPRFFLLLIPRANRDKDSEQMFGHKWCFFGPRLC